MISYRMLTSILVFLPATLMAGCNDSDPLGPEPTPFHGNTTGMVVEAALAPAGRCPANLPMLFRYQGTGTMTEMGQITVTGSECVFIDPEDPSTFASGQAEFTFTTADGDQLFLAYNQTSISFEPPPSTWVLWSNEPRATGGTGRFAGAELVDVTWEGGGNLMTYETYSTIDGEILLGSTG